MISHVSTIIRLSLTWVFSKWLCFKITHKAFLIIKKIAPSWLWDLVEIIQHLWAWFCDFPSNHVNLCFRQIEREQKKKKIPNLIIVEGNKSRWVIKTNFMVAPQCLHTIMTPSTLYIPTHTIHSGSLELYYSVYAAWEDFKELFLHPEWLLTIPFHSWFSRNTYWEINLSLFSFLRQLLLCCLVLSGSQSPFLASPKKNCIILDASGCKKQKIQFTVA